MRITRAKAIRLKCLDCSNNQPSEVRECEIKTCSLWRYRMGKEERDDLYHKEMLAREKRASAQKNSKEGD
jgi:hypothetical protein